MKLNYPIVYALMPIVEPTGWFPGLNELERQYDTACYIVSKCFLIGEKTTYTENGKKKLTYEVVFPYQKSHSTWEYSVPTYNLIHAQCTNSEYVEAIFNSYETATKHKKKLNEELCRNTCASIPYSESFLDMVANKKQEFDNKVRKYELLERQLLLNLAKLSNEKRKELDFVMNANGRLSAFHLYEFMEMCNDKKYLVYSIDKHQYDFLVSKDTNEDKSDLKTIDIPFSKPLLLCDSRISRLISDKMKGCYYFENHKLQYSEEIPAVTQEEIANIDENTKVFYTTETEEDVLDSFYPYKNISLEKLLKKKY